MQNDVKSDSSIPPAPPAQPTGELAIGDVIAVAEKLHEPLSVITGNLRDAETAFHLASRWWKNEDRHLWRMLQETHPDLFKKYHLSYDHERHQLMIMGHRPVKEDDDA